MTTGRMHVTALLAKWRGQADTMRETRPVMSSVLFDCAVELEKAHYLDQHDTHMVFDPDCPHCRAEHRQMTGEIPRVE